MRKAFLILLLMVSVFIPAQRLRPEILVRAGYIDISRILANYILAQQYNDLYNAIKEREYKLIDPFKRDIDNSIMELKLAEPRLINDELKIYWTDILRKQKDYDMKKIEIDMKLRDHEKKLNEEILKNIHSAISDIASKMGFNLILEKKNIYFSTPDVDLSNLVIEKLNSEYISTTFFHEQFEEEETDEFEE